MHAACDAYKALRPAASSLGRWSSGLYTISAVDQRRWSTAGTNAESLEEGEGNEASKSAFRRTQAPGAMSSSTLPVRIKLHAASEQPDFVRNVKSWRAIDPAARKKQRPRPVGRNRVTPAGQKQYTFPEGQAAGRPLIKKHSGKAAHLRPVSSSRDIVLDAINRTWKRDKAKRDKVIYDSEQPHAEERADVQIKNYDMVKSPSREPETNTKGFQSQNQARAIQTLDPFLHDLRSILYMLLHSTPQIATKEGDTLADLDSGYWEGAETDGNDVSHRLGDMIDDITNAPRPGALRVRTQWTGAREISTGLALQRRPQFWTQSNFERYMRRLAAVGREQEQYGEDTSGTSTATREIISLLKDKSFLPYIHPNTLDVALVHLHSQRCYGDMLQIFRLLKRRSFAFNALNFSRFVSAATWHDDHMDLRPILEHMLDCGFKPTGHTWFSFYKLTSQKYPSKRRLVLQAMQKKGLTSNGAPTLKDALVRSLGWIEDSKLTPNSPRREPNLGNNVDDPFPSSGQQEGLERI